MFEDLKVGDKLVLTTAGKEYFENAWDRPIPEGVGTVIKFSDGPLYEGCPYVEFADGSEDIFEEGQVELAPHEDELIGRTARLTVKGTALMRNWGLPDAVSGPITERMKGTSYYRIAAFEWGAGGHLFLPDEFEVVDE